MYTDIESLPDLICYTAKVYKQANSSYIKGSMKRHLANEIRANCLELQLKLIVLRLTSIMNRGKETFMNRGKETFMNRDKETFEQTPHLYYLSTVYMCQTTDA